jgi:putative membrane protein
MTSRALLASRAAMLLGLAVMIAKIFVAGEMPKYMNPALDPLTVGAGLILAVMGGLEMGRMWKAATPAACRCAHAHGHDQAGGRTDWGCTAALGLAAMLLGLIISPQALGSSVMSGGNVFSLLLVFPAERRQAVNPSRAVRDVPDLLKLVQRSGEAGVGQRVRVAGLVVRNDALNVNEFVLLRFSIVHCVADAVPIGVLVSVSEDPGVASDAWVEVEGVLAVRPREGDRLVSIAADRINVAEEPTNPYLPPVF